MRTPSSSRCTRIVAIAGLSALIALPAQAACGSATGTTATNATRATSAAGPGQSAQGPRNADYENDQAIITCYRQHGDPSAPDPNYDPSDGRWHLDAGHVPESAQQACQHLFPVTNPSPPVPQAEFQELLRFAQCMRQHGVHDWPDPTVSGDFALPQDLLTKTPAAATAQQACQRYIPSGGLNVSAAG